MSDTVNHLAVVPTSELLEAVVEKTLTPGVDAALRREIASRGGTRARADPGHGPALRHTHLRLLPRGERP